MWEKGQKREEMGVGVEERLASSASGGIWYLARGKEFNFRIYFVADGALLNRERRKVRS